ncbi:putative F-box protein At1g32420 [Arachis stenosperma]|uniref:putative F-box protein At1g32420 n=1 Tax=Arachis stenosperma TaxID=217475 RepID=UPI0025AC9763|nr:putative F-box protein At1g32420 [Arachis stenosperma]
MTEAEHIPEEIVANILRRLPPKSLIRCTAVSKSWRDLILTPSFISLHLRHSPPLLLLQLCNERSHPSPSPCAVRYSLRHDDPFLSDSGYTLILPPTALYREFSVVGLCHGLVCITAGHHCHSLVICNPSLRRYVSLPRPRHYRSLYTATVAFAFDPLHQDYKVVRLSCMVDDERYGFSAPTVEVYSLATGFWRTLSGSTPVCSLACVGKDAPHGFVNKIVHWGAQRREGDYGWYHFVLSFDVVHEVFGEVLLPESLAYAPEDSVTVIGGREELSVFSVGGEFPSCCEIWVMKEYGVVESWNKVFSFTLRGFSLEVPAWGISVANVTSPPVALCIRKSGEVLLLMDETGKGNLYSLDIERKRFTELGIGGEGYTWYLYSGYYAESLVLLNNVSGLVSY